jgi:hypothetical protein
MDRPVLPPPELLRRGLPPAAIGLFGLFVALAVGASAVAGTLGYDFLAYHAAASRVLAGGPLYDMSFVEAGVFGLFFYPPTFGPLVLPFGLLPEAVAVWTWTGLLVASLLAGVATLPVPIGVRWVVLLLAALTWPVAYAIKLGQVGPILFLAFAIGWRWLGSGRLLGASAAVGAAIKIQPGLVLVWALLAGRWAAVVAGAVVLGALAAVATVWFGITAWSDFLTLVIRVSDPISTPNNVTPGAVVYQFGVPRGVAWTVQFASTGLAIVAVVVAARRTTPVAGYLVALVASQLVSPVLWDHYAMLLLLPAAWLLARGRWWAAFIPLATPTLLVGIIPPIVYPVAFWATLAAVLVLGLRDRAETVVART